MELIFRELSLILLIAAVIAAIIYRLRQPLIVAYILTGLLIGPAFLEWSASHETLEVLSQLGIALLLFIIGLGLNPRVIKEVGSTAVITGLGQITFTAAFGFLIGRALGFPPLASLYIALALTFSSTIIVLKLLADKKDLGRLYGKIATGFLLVQDMIASLVLIAVTTLAQGGELSTLAMTTLLKGVVAVAVLAGVMTYLIPVITRYFAKSQEFLFLFALAWGLGLAALFQYLGFSIEIGALLAGITLATSPYSQEMSAKLRPLRDFFIILFFILLGSKMILATLGTMLVPALVFSVFILIGNPLIVMALMGILGYNKKTSFKAGLTVAQIGEFSLILVIVGQRIGHLSPEAVSLVTLVSIITLAISTYYIIYADILYNWLSPLLGFFERKQQRTLPPVDVGYDVIIFGYGEAGQELTERLKEKKLTYLIIDYDPEILAELDKQNIPNSYGDAADNEFLAELPIDKAKLVISTINEPATTTVLVAAVRKLNRQAVIFSESDSPESALILYELGANYVVIPRFVGTERFVELLDRREISQTSFKTEKDRQQRYLKKLAG